MSDTTASHMWQGGQSVYNSDYEQKYGKNIKKSRDTKCEIDDALDIIRR